MYTNIKRNRDFKGLYPKVVLGITIYSIAVSILLIFSVWHQFINTQPVQVTDSSDVTSIVEKVSKLILLDKEQGPTVSKIIDPRELIQMNNRFFKDAKEGDWLVIYPNVAIIYREEENLLINVGPVVQSEE